MNRVRQGMRVPAAHTDDWLVTYADMITLLLCFFVIFFVILSSRKIGQDEPYAAHDLAPALRDIHSTQRHNALVSSVQSDEEISTFNRFDRSWNSLADEAAARIGQLLPARPMIGSDAPPAVASAGPRPRLENPADTEPKGNRISMLEISSSAFFGSGSANLSESGRSILRDVAVELRSNQYEGYQIVVEGHTDDTPIATANFASNWELSTARAAAVVHFLLDQGIPAQRLRAAGYADTRPKVPNRDASGNAIPENQAQNRRVVIQLEKIETSE
jgi:flagellar motor protein MotB